MKDIIKQAFQDIISLYGDAVFTNPSQFKHSLGDVLGNRAIKANESKRLRNLLNTAIVDMQAYPRLKAAIEKNEFYVIGNLVSEMDSDYDVKRESAEIVMGCIAELFGYVALTDTSHKASNAPANQTENIAVSATLPINIQVSPSSNILFCGQCGKANDGANKFCSFCGMGISIPLQPHLLNKTSISNIVEPAPFSDYSFGGHDWLVLKIDNGKALLLRKQIWDKRPYYSHEPNDKNMAITWENCTLRKELNDEFCNQIPQAERSRIAETHLLNPKNPWFGTDGGGNTLDYVFLLSLDEVVELFGDSEMLKKGISPSERKGSKWPAHGIYDQGFHDQYSEKRIAYDENKVAWWLRSPGGDSYSAAAVSDDGTVYVYGDYVGSAAGGVRPALWLNL